MAIDGNGQVSKRMDWESGHGPEDPLMSLAFRPSIQQSITALLLGRDSLAALGLSRSNLRGLLQSALSFSRPYLAAQLWTK